MEVFGVFIQDTNSQSDLKLKLFFPCWLEKNGSQQDMQYIDKSLFRLIERSEIFLIWIYDLKDREFLHFLYIEQYWFFGVCSVSWWFSFLYFIIPIALRSVPRYKAPFQWGTGYKVGSSSCRKPVILKCTSMVNLVRVHSLGKYRLLA